MVERIAYDDLVVVDCAGCGRLLCTQLLSEYPRGLSPVRGRIKGVAYCGPCLRVSGAGVSGLCGGASATRSPSPWLENAVRALEDGS